MFSISTVYGAEDEVIGLARRRGIELELQGFAYWQNYGPRYRGEIAQRVAAAGASVRSIHGPFLDLVPASVDPQVVALARARFEAAMGDCVALDARELVLHSGWIPRIYPDEEWLERSHAFWGGFLGEARRDARVRVENVWEEDWRLLAELVDRLADDRLGVCLDLGHVNAFSSRSAREWIEGLGERIAHVHLHNNYGLRDEHNDLTGGSLDMEAVLLLLAERSPRATWNIEATLGLEESIDFLEEFYGKNGLGPDFG